MKKILLLGLMVIAVLTLQAQSIEVPESQIPAVVVSAFKTSKPNLPSYIKPTWYQMKQNGGSKILYKVSYMNGTQFDTYVYNLRGVEVFRRFDWYNTSSASTIPAIADLIKAVKLAYPSSSIQKIAELRAPKYNLNGYAVTMTDFKTRHFDLSNKAITTDLGLAIENAAFADASNF